MLSSQRPLAEIVKLPCRVHVVFGRSALGMGLYQPP